MPHRIGIDDHSRFWFHVEVLGVFRGKNIQLVDGRGWGNDIFHPHRPTATFCPIPVNARVKIIAITFGLR